MYVQLRPGYDGLGMKAAWEQPREVLKHFVPYLICTRVNLHAQIKTPGLGGTNDPAKKQSIIKWAEREF